MRAAARREVWVSTKIVLLLAAKLRLVTGQQSGTASRIEPIAACKQEKVVRLLGVAHTHTQTNNYSSL